MFTIGNAVTVLFGIFLNLNILNSKLHEFMNYLFELRTYRQSETGTKSINVLKILSNHPLAPNVKLLQHFFVFAFSKIHIKRIKLHIVHMYKYTNLYICILSQKIGYFLKQQNLSRLNYNKSVLTFKFFCHTSVNKLFNKVCAKFCV